MSHHRELARRIVAALNLCADSETGAIEGALQARREGRAITVLDADLYAEMRDVIRATDDQDADRAGRVRAVRLWLEAQG